MNYLGNSLHYTNLLEVALTNNGRLPVVIGDSPVITYADWNTITAKTDKLYTILEDADYMINIPTMKAHARAGITLTAKNHFGSHTRDGATHLHPGLVAPNEGTPIRTQDKMYRTQVDIMGHPMLGKNTMLFLIDALFSGSEATDPPTKWDMAPFNGDWTNSIFLSQDQVAIESVCFDFLRTEYDGTGGKVRYPNYSGVDDYLMQAADPANWPEDIEYLPDGENVLTSLGIHEHWNNQYSKEYSRNKGLETGIELLSVPDGLVASVEENRADGILVNGFISAYPNPFIETVNLQFRLSDNANVSVEIFNLAGQVIYQIPGRLYSPGDYSVNWNGDNGNGITLPGGIYIAKLKIITPAGLRVDSERILKK